MCSFSTSAVLVGAGAVATGAGEGFLLFFEAADVVVTAGAVAWSLVEVFWGWLVGLE